MGPVIAVTGATGFTGGALARRLVADGFTVRALVRGASRLESLRLGSRLEPVEGSLTDQPALDELVRGADTVFHVAAMYRAEAPAAEFHWVNVEGTRRLLSAAEAAGVRRFVHVSTAGVHGHVAVSPGDENAPIRPADHYQESKLAAEIAAREAGAGRLEVAIVRPCGIYGPGDLRMLKMFRMVDKGAFFFVGDGHPNFHPVYIDDLVEGMMLAATRPEAVNETFIIGGPRYLPLTEFVAACARALGRRVPSLHIPYAPMALAARACEAICMPLGIDPPLHRRRLSFFRHNRAFSIEKARRLLGYAPKVDIDQGFQMTSDWYRAAGLISAK